MIRHCKERRWCRGCHRQWCKRSLLRDGHRETQELREAIPKRQSGPAQRRLRRACFGQASFRQASFRQSCFRQSSFRQSFFR
ncbi:MAG: hypothetical protein DMG79_21630 [Acidobacteria bacterium]|nr:MAG: hypothetical protein DMG79_21630 [Acidobacteriota bacterium]